MITRMDHVGVIVEDLGAATEFFVSLGFELQGQLQMEHPLVNRLLALDGVRTEFAFVQTPDGHGRLELIKYLSPPAVSVESNPPANALGYRHIAFEVDDIHAMLADLRARGVEFVGELVNYEDIYWLCYVRGPEGIIVELAQKVS